MVLFSFNDMDALKEAQALQDVVWWSVCFMNTSSDVVFMTTLHMHLYFSSGILTTYKQL